jgi:hypothetical protein
MCRKQFPGSRSIQADYRGCYTCVVLLLYHETIRSYASDYKFSNLSLPLPLSPLPLPTLPLPTLPLPPLPLTPLPLKIVGCGQSVGPKGRGRAGRRGGTGGGTQEQAMGVWYTHRTHETAQSENKYAFASLRACSLKFKASGRGMKHTGANFGCLAYSHL